MVRAMKALASASRPGEVVLQRPGARYRAAPVILIGRRVPYGRFTPWLPQFAPAAALEARHEVVYRFFHTTDAAEAMAIARGLDARYLCLYGADTVRFDPTGILAPIHEEEGARVYRLVGAAPPDAPAGRAVPSSGVVGLERLLNDAARAQARRGGVVELPVVE